MKLTILALALLMPALATAQEVMTYDEWLHHEALVWEHNNREIAAVLCRKYLRSHGRAPKADEIRLSLARILSGGKDTHREALNLLRAVNADSPHATQAASLAESLSVWKFSTLPKIRDPKSSNPVYVQFPKEITAIYQMECVTPEKYREHLTRGEKADQEWPEDHDLIMHSRVENGKSMSLFQNVRLRRGEYRLRETIDGFSKMHRFSISSLALLAQRFGDRLFVVAIDPFRGTPVKGALVQGGGTERTTDKDGFCEFADTFPQRLIASIGDDTAVGHFTFDTTPTKTDSMAYFTTDRPIYRPGDTVRIHGIRRDRREGTLSFPRIREFRLRICDDRGRVLTEEQATWDASGLYEGSFLIAGEEPPLGDYSIQIDLPPLDRDHSGVGDGDPNWRRTASFEVATYRKPEFAIDASVSESGNRVKGTVRVRYRTGEPVPEGQIECTVQQSYTEASNALSDWHPKASHHKHSWFYTDRDSHEDDTASWDGRYYTDIGSVHGTLSRDGTFSFSLPRIEAPPGPYRLEVQIVDPVGLMHTEEFTLHGRAGTDAPNLAAYINEFRPLAGAPLQALAHVSDPSGAPMSGCVLERLLLRANEGSPGEEPLELEQIWKERGQTNATGWFEGPLPSLKQGRYRMISRTREKGETTAEHRLDFTVYKNVGSYFSEIESTPGTVLRLPRLFVRPGEKLSVFAGSKQHPNHALILVVSDDHIMERRWVTLKKPTEEIRFDVLPSWTPMVKLLCITAADNTFHTSSAYACVFPEDHLLDIEVETDRDTYRPGETASILVRTRSGGKPVAGNICLSIVDEAIFAIKEDQAEDIRKFFFPLMTRYSDPEGSIPIRWSCDEIHPFYNASGGVLCGAIFTLDEPRQVFASEPKIRKHFPDTLYWTGRLRTNADGTARISVPVSDALTKWRITARGTSGTDRFGRSFSSMKTTKRVRLRMGTPRVLRERERSTIFAVLHNGLEERTAFDITLETEGNLKGGGKTLQVRLKAGDTRRFSWEVAAAGHGTATVRVVARSAVESDAVETSFPVLPHGQECRRDVSATFQGTWKQRLEWPDGVDPAKSRLKLRVTPSLWGVVDAALPFLAKYPYGCVEQTMSRFLPAVIARQAGGCQSMLKSDLENIILQGLYRL